MSAVRSHQTLLVVVLALATVPLCGSRFQAWSFQEDNQSLNKPLTYDSGQDELRSVREQWTYESWVQRFSDKTPGPKLVITAAENDEKDDRGGLRGGFDSRTVSYGSKGQGRRHGPGYSTSARLERRVGGYPKIPNADLTRLEELISRAA